MARNERIQPQQWVVDQANFDLFLRRMETNEEFRKATLGLLDVIQSEKTPYEKHEAYWEHNQWLHDNAHVDVKDALWDYIDGRR